MRAVVYRGVNDLRLETVPVPRIGPGELLVQVAVCGVCPTDIKKIQYGTVPPPRIFGHETAGTIVRAGRARARLQDRRPRRPAPSRALPGLPFLPASRLRPMRDLQTHRHHRRIRAGGRRLRRIRPRHALRPARRRENSRTQFLRRRRHARTRQHRPQSRPPPEPFARRQRPRGRPGADWPHVHPPPPARRRSRHRHRFDALPPPPRQKIRRPLDVPPFPAPVTRHSPAAPWRSAGGSLVTLDAAVIAVPSDAVVQQALQLIRCGGQLMLFAHTKRLAPQGGKQRSHFSLQPSAFSLDLASICVDEKDLLGSYSSDFTLQREVARLVFSRQLDVRQLISHLFPLAQTAAAVPTGRPPRRRFLENRGLCGWRLIFFQCWMLNVEC